MSWIQLVEYAAAATAVGVAPLAPLAISYVASTATGYMSVAVSDRILGWVQRGRGE